MENIVRKTGDNHGGIRDVLFVPIINVPVMPDPKSTGVINLSDINLEGLTGWFYFKFTPESGSYKEEEAISKAGIFYKVTIDLAVAKDSLSRWRSFFDMEYHEFLVVVRDSNNITRIIGHQEEDGEMVGMRFKTKNETQPRWSALNAHECQFYLESTNKPRIGSQIQDLIINPDPAPPTLGDGEGDPIGPPVE